MTEICEDINYIIDSVNIILHGICKEIDKFDKFDNLFDAGIIDSFGVINLIAELEKKFQLKISSEDLTMDNFKSVKTIVALVNRIGCF